MKKPDLARHAPPGIDLKYLKNALAWGLIVASLYSLLFPGWLNRVHHNFFGDDAYIEPGMLFPDFLLLIKAGDGKDYMMIFRILIPCMLAFTIYHYAYHRAGSRSDYLMRRLPDRWEYHRRCWTLPLVCAGLVLLTEVVLLLSYFGIYVLRVPAEYRTPGQFATIWRALL